MQIKQKSVLGLKTLIKHSFLSNFLPMLLMSFTRRFKKVKLIKGNSFIRLKVIKNLNKMTQLFNLRNLYIFFLLSKESYTSLFLNNKFICTLFRLCMRGFLSFDIPKRLRFSNNFTMTNFP